MSLRFCHLLSINLAPPSLNNQFATFSATICALFLIEDLCPSLNGIDILKLILGLNSNPTQQDVTNPLKFGYSEKATQFEKIFHIEFDATQELQILSGRFFQILWPSQNIRSLNKLLFANGAC